MQESLGGDFVEVEITVRASLAFQTAGISVKWKTSDFKYIPGHGDSPDEVKAKLKQCSDIAGEAVSEQIGDVYGVVKDLADQASVDRVRYNT